MGSVRAVRTAPRRKPPRAQQPDQSTVLCDQTLRKVLSWLDTPQQLSVAALVCSRWADAARCREVWRRCGPRNMHHMHMPAICKAGTHTHIQFYIKKLSACMCRREQAHYLLILMFAALPPFPPPPLLLLTPLPAGAYQPSCTRCSRRI